MAVSIYNNFMRSSSASSTSLDVIITDSVLASETILTWTLYCNTKAVSYNATILTATKGEGQPADSYN